MRKIVSSIGVALIFLTTIGFAEDKDVSKFIGEWEGVIKPMKVELELTQNDGELSGFFQFGDKKIAIKLITIDEGILTFYVPIHPENKIDGEAIVFKLKLKDEKLVGKMREKKHPEDKTVDVEWIRKSAKSQQTESLHVPA